jgi:tetratricopeptide (TPR) repeat protein
MGGPVSSAQERFEKARFLVARGELAPARLALLEALAAEPDHLGALVLQARMLREERDSAGALRVLDQALLVWPRSAEVRNERARSLHALRREEDALAEAERARDLLDEGDNHVQAGPVYLTMVFCLREMGRLPEALERAEEGLARVGDAILAGWAATVEEELAEAQKEGC